MARQINDAGLALLKEFEGCKLTAYRCPAGVLTIGYGHTGPDVTPGLIITQWQATELLRRDLARFEAAVSRMVKVEISDNAFAALVAFAFNVGEGALGGSTLLKRVNKDDPEGAALQFGAWTHGGGKVLPGLVRRREAEAKLFLS